MKNLTTRVHNYKTDLLPLQ